MVLAALIAGCGGGGGAPTGDPAAEDTGPPQFDAQWVTGARAGDPDPMRLTAQTYMGSGMLGSAGDFSVQILGDGPVLVTLRDDQDRTCWLGWLTPTRTTVDAHSTPEVLAYFALGGPYLLAEARSLMLDQFRDGTVLDALAQAITDGYTAGGTCRPRRSSVSRPRRSRTAWRS